MALTRSTLLGNLLRKSTLRRWNQIAAEAETVSLGQLRTIRNAASELNNQVSRAARVAEGRLLAPLGSADTIPTPLHSDWTFRPDVWRMPVTPVGHAGPATNTPIGADVRLFHDCSLGQTIVRQNRNQLEDDIAPFGLSVEVFRFAGNFLSLAIQLPQSALDGLTKRHLIRLSGTFRFEQPLELFARLNVRHGPNTEQIVREVPWGMTNVDIDYDLAYTSLNENRLENAWIDLIFESPNMNMLRISDLTFSRRPRAEV